MDTYLLAISLPSFAAALINTIAGYQLIPVLQQAQVETGSYDAVLQSVIRGMGLASLAGALACGTQAATLISLINPALSKDQLASAGALATVAWFWLPCSVLGGVYSAALHLRQRFVIATFLMQMPSLGSIVFCLLLHLPLGTGAIIWGQTAGYFALLLGLHFALRPAFVKPDWRALRKMVSDLPLALLSLLLFVIYPLSDAVWGSRLGPAAVSYLGYMQRIVVGLSGLFVVGATTVLFPALARQAANQDYHSLREHLAFSLRAMLVSIAPLAVVLTVYATPILQLLFQRGAFGLEDVKVLSGLMPSMMSGMVAMSCVGLLFKALFAQNEIAAAAGLSTGAAGVYFFFSPLLSSYFGLNGIGFSYAITWWLALGAGTAWIWRGNARRQEVQAAGIFLWRLAANVSIIAFIALVFRAWFPIETIRGGFAIISAIGAVAFVCTIIYFLLGFSLLPLTELRFMVERAVRLFGWGAQK